MQVAHPHALLVQVLRQVLGHALGERGDQYALAALAAVAAFGQQVVDLVLDRADDADRVDQAGRADHLLDEHAAGALELPGRRRGRDEDRLRPHHVPLLELERAVVDAGRQAEAELGERALALVVALVHAADLRHRDVALVDEQDRVLGDVLEQGRRRLAGCPAGQVARIVLDARAGAGGHDHLEVGHGALLDPLGLEQLAGVAEEGEALGQLLLDALDRLLQRRLAA